MDHENIKSVTPAYEAQIRYFFKRLTNAVMERRH